MLGLSVISGSSWGFCLAIYDFVGLILGHFGPMFGPTTYWVSWRAICWAYLGPSGHIGSFQGYVGPIRHFRVKLGVLFGHLRFLGIYWATSGLCSALQHNGSVGGLYVGLILAQVAILGHFKAMLGLSVISGSSWGFCLAIYDFVGLILGHFGPMFGPTTYWVSWRAICWAYLGPSGHIGSFQGYVGPIWGHVQVFGPATYWVSWRAIRWSYLGPSGHIGILGHFKAMLGLSGVMCRCSALQHIGSVGGLYVGLILAQVAILGHVKATLGLSGVMCRPMLRSWRAIRPYAAISSQVC